MSIFKKYNEFLSESLNIKWETKTTKDQYGQNIEKTFLDWKVMKTTGYRNNSQYSLSRNGEIYGEFSSMKKIEDYLNIWNRANPNDFK